VDIFVCWVVCVSLIPWVVFDVVQYIPCVFGRLWEWFDSCSTFFAFPIKEVLCTYVVTFTLGDSLLLLLLLLLICDTVSYRLLFFYLFVFLYFFLLLFGNVLFYSLSFSADAVANRYVVPDVVDFS
jgi:hypothetical protein